MKQLSALLVGLAATFFAGTASAMVFQMYAYENADGANVSGLDLWFEVTEAGNYVDFNFYNSSSSASNVANIYFERSGVGDHIVSAVIAGESAGVDFNAGGSPSNPAPGNANPLGWGGTAARFRAANPAPTWGIRNTGPGVDPEWLKIRIRYENGISYDDVVSDLSSSRFRVAQHVTGMPQSIWTVSCPVDPVPLPASGLLLGTGLAGWALLQRIRRRR